MKALQLLVCGGVLLTLSAVVAAQTRTSAANDHFTFTANGTPKLDLNVKHWASEAERSKLTAALRDGGPKELESMLRELPDAGYLNWTDGLEYIVRYAARMPVPGGEDVVLATDRPMTFYWDKNISASMTDAPFTVIQMHLGEDGRGEGKVASLAHVVAGKDSIVLQDYAAQPTVMTAVERERPGAAN